MRRRGGGAPKREEGVGDADDTTRDGKPNGRGGRQTDCATCVTYAFLVAFFAMGVLIAAADRPPPRGGTPNTPWNPKDDTRGGGTRGGTGVGGSGNSRGDADDDGKGGMDDEGADEDYRKEHLPDIGLWEGLGIIVIDRLSKVRDYLEGVMHTLEKWEAKLDDVNENLDAYMEDMLGRVGAGDGGGGGSEERRRAVRGGGDGKPRNGRN
jgi:hypothetical protein